ncbi:MAG: hypothetical protein LBB08_00235 [Rickettsiales bacterium]|jgi:hypothetical protein|nr:hypothetical protein [Rickettsiales bacterium]
MHRFFILFLPVSFAISAAGAVPIIATKAYVDSGLATRVSNSGGTMTGPLALSGPPTEDLHAATKRYVDAAVAGLDTSISANVYDYGAYQGIYAGVMANWVPDTGHSIIVKKIGSGENGEIAIKIVGTIVCMAPKDLTPSGFLAVYGAKTAKDAIVQGAPGTGYPDRTCDDDGLHLYDNNSVILRQPPTLESNNNTIYHSFYNANRTHQPWDYQIMTYDGGILTIGSHTIDIKRIATGGSVIWTGGNI